MWSLFSEARVRQQSVFWSAVLVVGLFVSNFVRIIPSLGVAGLFVAAVGYAIRQRRIAQGGHWPATLSFVLVYGLHVVAGLLHHGLADKDFWQDLLLELPFLLLPVSFWLLPDWLAAHKRIIWLVLLGCCLVAAAGATTNYLLHTEEINELYNRSQVMPTAPDHIRFSLLISIAVLAGLVLLASQPLPARWRWVLLLGIGLLFVFQHLLAVRSGIVTLYAAGALWLGWQGWQLRRWRAMLTTLVLAAVLGGACAGLFATLQKRVGNTRYDAAQLELATGTNQLSITGRWFSYKTAWIIFSEHPLVGVGKARLPAEMAQQYSYLYPEMDPAHYLLPHNQFLYNLVAYGLLGLPVFLWGFYYPLGAALRRRNILVLLLYLIVSISFLVEYTLETQTGVLIGLFFILLAAAPLATEKQKVRG